MITAADLKFYLDPVQDMTLSASRVYVTEEMSAHYNRSHMDKIVNVRAYVERSGGRCWWVTDDGDYVGGAPISDDAQHYVKHVGIIDGGVFVVGELYGVSGGMATLQQCRRSDNAARPGRGGTQYRVKEWMRAAPWATELMPEKGDTNEVITAKRDLAKARWKRRNAMRVIVSESMDRNWNNDLDELREEHGIPTGVFGAYVEGHAMLSVGRNSSVRFAELDDDERAKVARLTRSTPVTLDQRINVPVEFLAPLTLRGDAAFTSVSSASVTAAARKKFDDYSLTIGSFSMTPVLRQLTAS
jgi:hypothetical protein